ncbi:MAG: L-aspartate oxidase [Gemmatimonadota bacterium]
MSARATDRVAETDVLVLGSGIAGLSYAIKAAAHGTVTVITKKEDSEANTNYAQGGIAAVMDPADSFDAHIADTLRAGDGLCDVEAVRLLVEEGPARVRELIDYGVRFSYSTEDPEELSLAREGGHSARRIVRADDLTGRVIEAGLLDAAARAGVRIHEHYFALDLWMIDSDRGPRCAGAVVVDRHGGELVAVRARVTYVATGGCGQAYRFTTNPSMAYRAGAAIANMEFIQFHPTGLYPVEGKPFLISETVRGEGAILRNLDGQPFMQDHGTAELAPRDEVARAIDAEMRNTGASHVWLDCGPISRERFAERFPNILATCRERGFDPPDDMLPVVPAAHYLCGGIQTDLWGRTGIRALLAVGEVACTGVHGANRLASNSLLEAVVFAKRAAEVTQELLAERDVGAEDPPVMASTPPVENSALELRSEIGKILWDGAGIVRDDDGLARAARRLEEVGRRVPSFSTVPEMGEAVNLFQVAQLIVESARRRHESRGLHHTLTYPETDPGQQRDTVLVREVEPPVG